MGLLESAMARNHPFLDGNKQIAFVALETVLILNEAELAADDAAFIAWVGESPADL